MSPQPNCPIFGRCGGCSLQHISNETQLENKKNLVHSHIIKSGISIESDDIKVFHGNPYKYRNRMDFVFSGEKLGLRKKGAFDEVIDVAECPISNDNVNKLLDEVRQWFQTNKNNLEIFDFRKKTGVLRYAVIRAPDFSDDLCISFVLKEESVKLGKYIEMIKEFAEKSSAKNIIITYVRQNTEASTSENFFPVKGEEWLNEVFLGKKLLFHCQGFFQNNSNVAQMMILYVRSLLENESKREFLLDLYGGVGTFGICCADLFAKVLTVESFAQSAACAKSNISENKIANAQAVCKDASQSNKLGIASNNLFVITDPPRSGMGRKAIERLLVMQPRKIIYISCNPKELEKDLAFMKKEYSAKSIAIFDMFPQTSHVEAVVELSKKY